MPLRIVRLGSPRAPGEGTRIGTVHRPPRGVPKAEFARRDYYDVWYPQLAPSAGLLAQGQQVPAGPQGDKDWAAFARQFRKELAQPEASRTLEPVSHIFAAALECNRDEWMRRVRRMGSCPCKQPGRPIARFHSNPPGKCLFGWPAALRCLPIARAIGRPPRLACHPEKALARLQKYAKQVLDLLAALSHHGAMSLGCYCEDEARCHRSVLRAELLARGADVADVGD